MKRFLYSLAKLYKVQTTPSVTTILKKIIISIAQKNLQQHQVLQTSSPIQGLFVIASVSPSRVLTSVVEKRVRMFDADLTDDNLLKIYKVSCVSLYIALSPSLR